MLPMAIPSNNLASAILLIKVFWSLLEEHLIVKYRNVFNPPNHYSSADRKTTCIAHFLAQTVNNCRVTAITSSPAFPLLRGVQPQMRTIEDYFVISRYWKLVPERQSSTGYILPRPRHSASLGPRLHSKTPARDQDTFFSMASLTVSERRSLY